MTKSTVSDELYERIRTHFTEDAIVELTALIGFQNLSSKFNAVFQIETYGFAKKTESS